MLMQFQGKRKATDDAPATSKKAKLANGDAKATGNEEEEYTSVFVGGLPFDVDNDRLQQEFAKFGDIESAIVMMDRQTGNSRGFGYVHFATHEQAKKAKEEGTLVYRHAREQILRPGVLGGLLGLGK